MNTFENSTKKTVAFTFLLFILMSMNFYANWRIIKPPIKVSTQQEKITIDKNLINILSAGNRRFISSIYWIETLMNSDLEHYQGSDFGNWMFNRFDTITSLDPEFYEAYLFGGIYLSIVKDDEKGAKYIYEKGLTKYPEDIDLLYNAGFNDYFELDLQEDAIKKFSKLSQIPMGIDKYPFAISLSEKLKLETGSSPEDAYAMMIEVYKKTKGKSFVRKFYKQTLYGLKAQIDLECLNNKRTNCSKVDFNGNLYKFDHDTLQYSAAQKWKKFKIRRKIQN